MAEKTVEYYKSLQPTQLIAERGTELVVINPGSQNLRIGFASWQAPVTVPHCIAWYTPGKQECLSDQKGAVGEQVIRHSAPKRDREETCLQVESLLGVRTFISNQSDNVEFNRGGYQKLEQEHNNHSEVQWTQVLQPNHADEETRTFRRYICGEEALKIPASQPYVLRRPVCRGRFNLSHQYPMQQVYDDIYVIWEWALSTKLSLDKRSRRNLSAVLVVPDTFDNREVKELVSVLLKELEFQSVVVHQECVAATFGNGVSTACVVQLGAQVASITCVEDGVSILPTHRVLPYGGEDISRCLLWIQQRHENWPPLKTDPFTDSLDMNMLDRLKESHCSLIAGGEPFATAEVSSCVSGREPDMYRVNLVALNVPPSGLFYPALLAPDERKLSKRSWYYTDHEDMLVDEIAVEPASNGRSTTLSPSYDSCLGLHEAIVSSVLSTGRFDLKAKFFSNILLVGGVASTRGIAQFLENKVMQSIPRQEAIDRVEVLQSRGDPSALCWKGGVMLGLLDFAREVWIQRNDWVEGGLRVGSSKKYKDSISLHAQAFWYNAVLE